MSVETVARRYAAALADVAVKNGSAEPVRSELKVWEDLIETNAELRTAFGNPSIAQSKKEGVLEGLIAKTKPSKITANFLRVLLQNGRLVDLAEINKRFDVVIEERSGAISGEVISAHDLAADQRKEIESNLKKITGKDVKVNYLIDKDIIGGVVTRIGSTVYDCSVRTQLENLKEQLMGS